MQWRRYLFVCVIYSSLFLFTGCNQEVSQEEYDFYILVGAYQGVQRANASQNRAQVKFDGIAFLNQPVTNCDIDNSSTMSIRIEFSSYAPGGFIRIQPVPPPVVYTFPGAFLDVDFLGAHFPADAISCTLVPVQSGPGRYRASLLPGCQILGGHVLDQLDIDCIPN